jgi:hypothetical protein
LDLLLGVLNLGDSFLVLGLHAEHIGHSVVDESLVVVQTSYEEHRREEEVMVVRLKLLIELQ